MSTPDTFDLHEMQEVITEETDDNCEMEQPQESNPDPLTNVIEIQSCAAAQELSGVSGSSLEILRRVEIGENNKARLESSVIYKLKADSKRISRMTRTERRNLHQGKKSFNCPESLRFTIPGVLESKMPGHGMTDACANLVVAGQGAIDACANLVVSGHGATDACANLVVSGHGATDACANLVVSSHGATDACANLVVSGQGTTDACANLVLPTITQSKPEEVKPIEEDMVEKIPEPSELNRPKILFHSMSLRDFCFY